MSRVIKAKIIQKPQKGTKVILLTLDTPSLVDYKGGISYMCGNCEYPIAKDVHPGQYAGNIVLCPNCKSYNELEV